MTLEEDLKACGFENDPTGHGRERWTHFQKGITCLRQPYMTGEQWEAEQRKCIAEAHGDNHVVP